MTHPLESPSLIKYAAPRWMLGGFVLVLLFLGGITILERSQLGRADNQIESEQLKVAERAFDVVIDDFESIQSQLLKKATAVAERRDIGDALEGYTFNADLASEERLVRYFASRSVDDRESIELYTAAPRLVAWKGHSLPPGTIPDDPNFLDGVRVEVINDNGVRQALVVWVPVVREGRMIGAVRASRIIAAQMPVENQFLKSYTLADTWRRLSRQRIRVWLNQEVSLTQSARDRGILRPLHGLDGNSLGAVFIPFPGEEDLIATIANRYNDIQAFGLVVLFLLLVVFVSRWLQYYGLSSTGFSAHAWKKQLGVFGLLTLVWWGGRFMLLWLEAPARWQRGKAPFAPLFDPSHFASDFGWGLMRSMGDLFTTAVFGFIFVVWFVRLVTNLKITSASPKPQATPIRGIVAVIFCLLTACAIVGLTYALDLIVQHAVIDSSLDYVTRTGLLPERLVFFVFCSLLLITISIMGTSLGLAWLATLISLEYWPGAWNRLLFWGILIASSLAGLIVFYANPDVGNMQSLIVSIGFLVVSWGISYLLSERKTTVSKWIHFRAALLGVLLLAVPLYVLLSRGMDTQLRERMVEVSESFDTGRDLRVIFAMEQVLYNAAEVPEIPDVLETHMDGIGSMATLDTLAQQLLLGSSLASVGAYDISITLFDSTDTPLGRYVAADENQSRRELDVIDKEEFSVLRSMYVESGTDSILVDQVTGRRESDQIQYEGLGPIYEPDSLAQVGWVMVRAEPKTLLRDEGTLFPKVLLPTAVNQLHGNLSFAEFQDRVLIRSFGSDFGRYRMQNEVFEVLKSRQELWMVDGEGDRQYLTYYRRKAQDPLSLRIAHVVPTASSPVTAVKAPLNNLFDHLYYLLRIAMAGLVLGGPLYLILRFGWFRELFRKRVRNRFKDRVLNAFLVVGIFAVGIVGIFGLRVVTSENEHAIESWIKSQLERVEESLALRAQFGELPSETLERINVNELAAQVGLDLNVYAEDKRLLTTSREQLIRDRLIDTRLPIEAYQALLYDGVRHAFTNERVGEFEYMAGYRVLPDRSGNPRYIISVPTLPEQERIEEERARTVAYLFGALLLMMVAVMLTASLLANRLAQPIGRLRQGLEAVAQGRFERPLPVETQDEIGELVRTFNGMQEQLADSRRKLAQQERQLAWREMARQVAHEIKNPLTPMKLSVQHLRRAMSDLGEKAPASSVDGWTRFKTLFERITGTLIEQADALARIANEFSSFARLPKRIVEPLDLNSVIQEAVSLMQEQADVDITIDLFEEPLVLRADREELRRIYINLIKNAIEATPEDQNAQVSATTSVITNGKEGGWAYSEITDRGTGIPADMQDRIFEPNFSSKTSGTGLGLAIVKKSIEDLSGEIGFNTAQDEGTTFWIRLPLFDD